MSKFCKECGSQIEDNVSVCPKCGCPCATSSLTEDDKKVLSIKRSAEAEATVSELAEVILKGGKSIAILVALFLAIGAIGLLISEGSEAFLFAIYLVGFAVLAYRLIIIISKAIWAVMILFVNMSITARHIEINTKK